MDRAYVHFARLMRFVHAGAFFVVRSKYNLQCRIVQVDPTNEALGILKDERIVLMGKDTQTSYPVPLRRIEFYDREQDRYMAFLTNHFELQASQIAVL